MKRFLLQTLFFTIGFGFFILFGFFSSIPIQAQVVSEGPTQEDFAAMNPLVLGASDPVLSQTLDSPGGIVSRFLGSYAFPIAGIALFVMILWGGFEIVAQSAGKQSMEAGRKRMTAAVAGFALLFCSFWIAQVVQTVLGVKIL